MSHFMSLLAEHGRNNKKKCYIILPHITIISVAIMTLLLSAFRVRVIGLQPALAESPVQSRPTLLYRFYLTSYSFSQLIGRQSS
jgi:hypothetical protein